MNEFRNTKHYKMRLNEILKTTQQIEESVCEEDFRKMQLFTILLKSQISQTLDMMGEKNNIKSL